jgi:hypothetical protein
MSNWQRTIGKMRQRIVLLVVTFVVAGPAWSANWLDMGNWNTNWYRAGQSSYTISNAQQLAGLAKLVNDGMDSFSGDAIRLSSSTSTISLSGKNWTPIGTLSTPFAGNFDGNGRVIYGLTATNGLNYQGLFGYVDAPGDVVFTNIHLTGVLIKGGGGIGGVAGYMKASYGSATIANCSSQGTVSGTNNCVGGIMGVFYSPSIYVASMLNCSSTGNVSSTTGSYVGGVVGLFIADSMEDYSLIGNCSSTGSVSSAGDFVGGVVGSIWSSGSWMPVMVTDCSSTGDVLGNQYVGGIIGWNENGYMFNNGKIGTVSGSDSVGGIAGTCRFGSETMANCVVAGAVTGSGSSVGAILGRSEYSIIVNYCYFLANSSTNALLGVIGNMDNAGHCATFENVSGVLKNGTGYEGGTNLWYVLNRWVKASGRKMWWADRRNSELVWPYLTTAEPVWPVTVVSFNPQGGAFSNGKTTTSNVTFIIDEPYGSAMPQGLTKKENTFDGWTNGAGAVEMPSSIVRSSVGSLGARWILHTNWIQAAVTSWYTVGQSSYTISNAQQLAGVAKLVNDGATRFAGCTIRLGQGTNIIDLSGKTWTAIGGQINSFAGSFDGNGRVIHGVSITNYWDRQGLFGTVNGAGDVVLTNIHLTGVAIKGGMYVGGLAGQLFATAGSATVAGCSMKGNVSGSWDVGGIVGKLNGRIYNCIYIGDVSGEESVGGIAGDSLDTEVINNCVFAGKVTGGQNSMVGGILGTGFSGGPPSVNYCYFLKNGVTNFTRNAIGAFGSSTNWGTFSNVMGTLSMVNGVAYGGRTNLTDALNAWVKDRQPSAGGSGQSYLWWSDRKDGQRVWPYFTAIEPVWVTCTPVPVPYAWMDTYYFGLSGVAAYEAAALLIASNNLNRVWECYTAGLNPTNEDSVFTAYIGISNSVKHIWWQPNITNRNYTIVGKTNLNDSVWHSPTNTGTRFFKVKVSMQ